MTKNKRYRNLPNSPFQNYPFLKQKMSESKKAKLIRIKKAIKMADIKEGDKILDLGCGNCELFFCLPPYISYYGIDKKSNVYLGNIFYKTIIWDLEKGLPSEILNQKFNIIFMLEFLEHIENFKSLLIQCREILSKDGKIIISTPSNNRILYGDFFNGIGEEPTHIHCFRKTNMRNLARICGYKITGIKGTFIKIPPILKKYILIPSNQTIYTNSIIYRLENQNKGEKIK